MFMWQNNTFEIEKNRTKHDGTKKMKHVYNILKDIFKLIRTPFGLKVHVM